MGEAGDNLFPGVRVVLVETSHPGNIGGAARAMKNMGLGELALVRPQRFPDGQAVSRAASAADLVRGARVVATLDEAIADCQLVVGTSARSRSLPWPMLSPEDCAGKVLAETAAGGKAALLFGRESRGLKNDELQQCQYHVNIPASPAYASLNLAMAVQVLAYELLKARLAGRVEAAPWDMPPATAGELGHFLAHLEKTLVGLDFHDPENPRQLLPRLKRLFQRVRLDRMEVNILRGILAAIERRNS